MTQPQLTVVIVGGGIGGLFAANALIAHGLVFPSMSKHPRSAKSGQGCF